MRIDEGATKDIDSGGVINALPGMVWTTRLDGQGDFVNRTWREYTGLSSQDALEYGWKAAIHPDDLTAFTECCSNIRQSDVALEIDARLRRFDGEFRWFVLRGSTFHSSDTGNLLWCWLASFADEGPATDGRMRRMFDILPWQAGFFHAPYALEFCNLQGFKDFDMTFEQLKQWRTSGHTHVDDHERNQIAATKLVATGELFDEQIRMLYPDGAYRWMRARAVPVRDAQGNIVRYVSIQVDVDDLKRAEDLLAAEVKLLERVATGAALPPVLDALSRHVEELCGDCFCAVLLVAPDRQHFHVGAGPNLPDTFKDFLEGKPIDRGYDSSSLAVIDKCSIVAADLVEDSRWKESRWPSQAKAHGYESCWSAPIVSGSGKPSGVIAIYRRQAVGPRPAEQQLVDRFTKLAAIAIDRTSADAALRTSERELRETLGQLSAGQRLSKTGSFTSDVALDQHRWSDEFYRIFEIDPVTIPQIQLIRNRVHLDDLPLFEVQIQRQSVGSAIDFTFRIVTPIAGVKHLRAVARPIEHIDGRHIFMGTVQDITESKIAEVALKASESEQRRVNMQLTDAHRLSRTGSFTWDVMADQHTWTEEIYRLFECDPAVKVDMPMMLKTIHPEDLPAVEDVLGRATHNDSFELDFRVQSRSGSVKHARVVGRRIGQSIDRPVFMGALQDVTASKVAEEALNKARSELAHVARVATLNAMTASIAHEVNQPISGILTNANTCVRMLASDPPNVAGAAETARRTIRDAHRASEVIKRLRDMFDKKAPVTESVDLNEAAREVIALSSSELQRSRVIMQTHFDEHLPAISGDRIQLQQVILNLLLNAADAMASVEDRPRVLLLQTEVNEQKKVNLLVRDSGIGVDPSSVEKLFGAFYTTKAHGMGVGLAISRSIIENHAGFLWAEPNEGPGATFGFSIPCLSSCGCH